MLDFITVNEHSSIRMEGPKIIYADPFRITDCRNDADIILVTHAHYDHFSPEDIRKVNQDSTLYVMPESMVEEALNAGFSQNKIYPMVPGTFLSLPDVLINAVPSYNVGKPMHPPKNGWLGYVVTMNGKRIYIAGDCDLMPEEPTVKCDIAMIPIGGTYTMNPTEGAKCVNQIKPKYVIPIHYGTLVGDPADFTAFAPLVHKEITIVAKLP